MGEYEKDILPKVAPGIPLRDALISMDSTLRNSDWVAMEEHPAFLAEIPDIDAEPAGTPLQAIDFHINFDHCWGVTQVRATEHTPGCDGNKHQIYLHKIVRFSKKCSISFPAVGGGICLDTACGFATFSVRGRHDDQLECKIDGDVPGQRETTGRLRFVRSPHSGHRGTCCSSAKREAPPVAVLVINASAANNVRAGLGRPVESHDGTRGSPRTSLSHQTVHPA